MPVHPKLVAAGTTGAAAILLIWILSLFHIDMPEEVAESAALLIALAAGWFKSGGSANGGNE
jgi:hypothetical protein